MLKGWFCGYCFAAIPRPPSLTLYIFFLLDFSVYIHVSPPLFLSSLYPPTPLFLLFPSFPFSAGHTASQGQMGQHRFSLPESPSSKALFADDWELWSRARNTFQGCQHPCLDWLILFKHAHRHRQAHNLICLLNLWLRHIKIKMTACIKAELGGESLSHRLHWRQGSVVCSRETDKRVR